jgi:hypothetical protein
LIVWWLTGGMWDLLLACRLLARRTPSDERIIAISAAAINRSGRIGPSAAGR